MPAGLDALAFRRSRRRRHRVREYLFLVPGVGGKLPLPLMESRATYLAPPTWLSACACAGGSATCQWWPRRQRVRPNQTDRSKIKPKSGRFKPKKWQRHLPMFALPFHQPSTNLSLAPSAIRHQPSLSPYASLPAKRHFKPSSWPKPSEYWAKSAKNIPRNLSKNVQISRTKTPFPATPNQYQRTPELEPPAHLT
jgi:hypothetical protein